MVDKQRANLNFDDESLVDIGSFAKKKTTPKKPDVDPEVIKKVAEESGFISRQPTKKRKARRRSPYTVQTNIKTRNGMKELIQEVGERMNAYDQEVIETAIQALLEKENMTDLMKQYDALTRT